MVPMASVSLLPKEPFSTRPAATLSVLTGLNALNYLDRFLLSPLLPLIIAGLSLSDRQAGSLQSAFILVYALVCPVAGWLGDRMSRLRIAALGVALWSIATFASGHLHRGYAFLAVRPLPALAACPRPLDLLRSHALRHLSWLSLGRADRRALRLAAIVLYRGRSRTAVRSRALPAA